MSYSLHIEVTQDHSAYQWAKKQSDAVNAMGHIGTHLDCYTKMPDEAHYQMETEVIDCTAGMPDVAQLAQRDVSNKTVILYTGVLRNVGYGTKAYGEAHTFLGEEVLDLLLKQKPRFILIDACGIGNHGEEHIRFDKKCEAHGCFVIENVNLIDRIPVSGDVIEMDIDLGAKSTGKPCRIFYAPCEKELRVPRGINTEEGSAQRE